METPHTHIPVIATHPGVLIKDEIDAIGNLTQKELAKELGVKASFLNEVIKGKRPVTADLAILLEKTLEIPADYWMKFQSQYEIDNARIKEKNIKKIENIELWKVIKEYVPVNYLKRCGHLFDDLEQDIEKVKEIYQVSNIDNLISSFSQRKFAFFRKSEKLKIDEKNMFAWSSLAMYEAKLQSCNTFNFNNINTLCQELGHLFHKNTDTLLEIKKTLNQYGIKFILVEKLEKTPIDGFSFWSDDNPVIALTLRHTRIDNFAFTLMHEIGHIELHLKNNKEQQFLDLTKKYNLNKFEIEADNFAQEKLIPSEIWKSIFSNKTITENDIINIGNENLINPAIILGRVCYEMDFYAIKTNINKAIN